MAVAFAVPCLLMAQRLWRVWRDPMAIEEGAWVRIGVGVFVMEFILTHAGIFMAGIAADAESSGTRWASALGLTFFYGLFAIAISLGFQSRMLLHSFLWLIGGRFLALIIGISEHAAALLMAHAVVAAVIYFAMVILSVFLPWPRFGITPEVAAKTRVPNATGAWVDRPHRAIGAATVYFLLLGIAELALLSWIGPGRLRLS
jgi:hypothetical protein